MLSYGLKQYKTIGLRITEIRKLKGFTQEELAEKTVLSLRTIQRIEKGEVDPRKYTIRSIAEMLEVNMDDIVPQEKDVKLWLGILHLTNIIPIIILPLIIWLIKRKELEGYENHFRDVMNFQISINIYCLGAFLLVLVAVGVFLLPIIGIFSFFIAIINTVRVLTDQDYNYPLTIRFIRNLKRV